METNNEIIKKYESLYLVTKEILERELKRDTGVEEKAARSLTVIGLLIAAAGYAGKDPLLGLIPPNSSSSWIGIVVFSLLWLSLLSAVIILFRVLSIRRIDLPVNDGLVDYYDEHQYLDILYGSSLNHVELEKQNEQIIDRKVRLVEWGHRLILVAIILFVFFAALLVFRKWTMPSDNQPTLTQEIQNVRERTQ